jgi:adenosylmethionine-8-amino-7-oxononanoate aminotransferase
LLVIERGEGPYLFDVNGRRYIDALSSLFCAQLGYSYGTEIAETASEQLSRLPFHSNWGTTHPRAIELAEALIERAPCGFDHAFFTSGGSESVETAWKLVRQFHVANGQPQRTKAIARQVAYHGVTLGALSFTGVESMKEQFGPPAVETIHISNTNSYRAAGGPDPPAFAARLIAELEQAIVDAGPETVAMIIAEPMQNAGGCLVPPPGYWAALRELADRYGILVVADEVITAFGRLGEWFGSSRYDARPDLITCAKGLSAAYAPLGAVLVGQRVAAPFYEGKRGLLHGYTFGGHPVSAAISLRVLEIMEREGLLERVRERRPALEAGMRSLLDLPIVGDVRGDGFFWAAELVKDRAGTRFAAPERELLIREVLPNELLRAGLIARPDDRGDSVIQIAPPLICSPSVLNQIVESLGEALQRATAVLAKRGVEIEGAGS